MEEQGREGECGPGERGWGHVAIQSCFDYFSDPDLSWVVVGGRGSLKCGVGGPRQIQSLLGVEGLVHFGWGRRGSGRKRSLLGIVGTCICALSAV